MAGDAVEAEAVVAAEGVEEAPWVVVVVAAVVSRTMLSSTIPNYIYIKSVCHMLNHFLFLVPPFETILRYAVRFWPWRRARRRARWVWPWRSRWKGKILSK